MKVVVIGGGPAGMLAAWSAAMCGEQVVLLEKNDILGKKILITGKGRCNITSSLNISDFVSNVPGNGRFLYSAFDNFSNEDILRLLKDEGVSAKEERGNRYFPVSDNAEDVRAALERIVRKAGVSVKLNSNVVGIGVDSENRVDSAILKDGRIPADKIVLATGGKSYPLTGSTGDGYMFARELGHTVNNVRGALVPLTADREICSCLQGLSLRNVAICFVDIVSANSFSTSYLTYGSLLE